MAITVALDPNNSAAQNKTELVNALNSYSTRGGEIRLPRSEGPFNIDPGIVWPARRNLDLVGDGSATAYEDGFGGTQIKFTSGSIGIDISQVGISDPAMPYARIHNISFHGNNACQIGLKVGGISEIDHVEVKNCLQANICATQLVNSITLDHVSVIGGGNIGLWIGPDNGSGTTPNNTRITVYEIRARANQVGVRVEQSQGVRFNGGVIEANYREGMVLMRASSRVLSDFIARDLWFEANWRGAFGYAIVIDGTEAPEDIRFYDCEINVGGSSRAMLVTKVNGGLLSNPKGSGIIDLAAGCQNFGLLDVPASYTVSNGGTGNWQKTLSQIGSGGGGGGPVVLGDAAFPILNPTPLSDASVTLAPSQIINTACEIFPTTNRILTLPTAADIIAAFGNYLDGAAGLLAIMNRSNNTSVKTILMGNTGASLKGKNQLGVGSGLWSVTKTGPTSVEVANLSCTD